MQLTPEQALPTENIDEHKLIIALPGSGKTHTLIALVHSILTRTSNSQVLMVTFTNASASEMKHRLEKRLGSAARRARATTFASLMLSMWRPLANGRKMILGGEQMTYIRRAALNNGCGTDSLVEIASLLDERSRSMSPPTGDDLISRIYADYLNLLSQFNRADLNVIAQEVIEGVKSGAIPPVPERYILIDEFQDTSSSDFAWVSAHIERGKYVYAVGDDDQSIYSWRGADGYESMLMLQEIYGAVGYTLSTCFRCSPKILAAAKRLIDYNDERIDKQMRSGKTTPGVVDRISIPPKIVSGWTKELESMDSIDFGGKKKQRQNRPPTKEELKKQEENRALERARFIVETIITENPFEWAILARTNADLDLIEKALAERKYNSVRLGGRSVFDSEHAAGIVKLLYGISQKKQILCLSEGLGWLGESETVISYIYASAMKLGFGAINGLNSSNWLQETVKLHALATEWQIDTDNQQIIQERVTNFMAIIQSRLERRADKDAKLQLSILRMMLDILLSTKGSLADRIMSLYERVMKNTRKKADHKTPDAVKLATLTGSKGLEFPRVWIMSVDDGKLPSKKALESINPAAALEEERRLLYVGMTRAEEHLRISYTEEKHSKFVTEIFGYV
jgi:superfamily I DNA/RNA helicase